MNLERVFDSIMRIYPKAFRDRFGEELKLGFQDEINAKPSKLEIAKLLSDTLTAAVWERLQVATWLYWFCAAFTIFLIEKATIVNNFPNTRPFFDLLFGRDNLIYYVMLAITVLLRLERVPSRLKFLSMVFFVTPHFLLTLGINSINLSLPFWTIYCFGMIFFGISNLGYRSLKLPILLLKISFLLQGIVFLIYYVFETYLKNNLYSLALGITSVVGILFFGTIILVLLWKPRAVIVPLR